MPDLRLGNGPRPGPGRPPIFHFGVDALSNGTLFDDQAPCDSQAWLLPVLLDPDEVADGLPQASPGTAFRVPGRPPQGTGPTRECGNAAQNPALLLVLLLLLVVPAVVLFLRRQLVTHAPVAEDFGPLLDLLLRERDRLLGILRRDRPHHAREE